MSRLKNETMAPQKPLASHVHACVYVCAFHQLRRSVNIKKLKLVKSRRLSRVGGLIRVQFIERAHQNTSRRIVRDAQKLPRFTHARPRTTRADTH